MHICMSGFHSPQLKKLDTDGVRASLPVIIRTAQRHWLRLAALSVAPVQLAMQPHGPLALLPTLLPAPLPPPCLNTALNSIWII